jgi:hypothetical protein
VAERSKSSDIVTSSPWFAVERLPIANMAGEQEPPDAIDAHIDFNLSQGPEVPTPDCIAQHTIWDQDGVRGMGIGWEGQHDVQDTGIGCLASPTLDTHPPNPCGCEPMVPGGGIGRFGQWLLVFLWLLGGGAYHVRPSAD